MSEHDSECGESQKRAVRTGRVQKVANVALWAELALLSALTFALLLPPLVGFRVYGVLSGSMEPAIETGSLALVDGNVRAEELEAGDVAAFALGNGEMCTHRVVAIDYEAEEIRTKGDANASEDLRPVPFADVFGETVGSVPSLGGWLTALSENKLPWAMGLLAATVVLAFASAPAKRAKRKKYDKESDVEHQTGEQSESEICEKGVIAALARRWATPLLVVALVAVVGMSGALAYFTGTDTVENEFTISEGLADKIEVVEPHWDTTDADGNGVPDAAEDLVSLQTVTKDPAVVNKSDVEAWAFLQVKVPTAEVSLLADDGTPAPASTTELFTYELGEGWVEHGEPVAADGYTTHTYLYRQKLASGATTPAAFNSVQLVNLVEAQGTSGADSIDVVGCAIQANGFATAEEAWDAYCGQLA